ncbi:MAG: helix-turn-helix domain-containing protein [Actinomycetota bacterium]|nr:TetR/AcrR family transcriptional regulator [Acidimicrobiales bacterium]MEC8922750.1 helix-turn-helix domain-containing protein [Actinomycetota bacterium]MEC8976221.1 helix-turn-helix domain-containing protein [Actinomycetota bacterium]MEC9269598.1 helix-turn-helix domain-containing protein [Actinomycetota bacterium]MED5173088.1 helix-turn-helix domain-containing protein [Actinomycetota bacterium]
MAAQTRERILDTSLAAFGLRGYDSTSLDELAAELGITKQAILYHFSSKEHLLTATIELAVKELGSALGGASKSQARGFQRIEDLVRATFSLAARRPEVLGLVRLVSRQGGSASGELASAMSAMLGDAVRFVEREMVAGRFRRLEPRMLLLAVYSAVIGVATEPEVMRALGLEPDLRSLVKARRETIEFLRAALIAD